MSSLSESDPSNRSSKRQSKIESKKSRESKRPPPVPRGSPEKKTRMSCDTFSGITSMDSPEKRPRSNSNTFHGISSMGLIEEEKEYSNQSESREQSSQSSKKSIDVWSNFNSPVMLKIKYQGGNESSSELSVGTPLSMKGLDTPIQTTQKSFSPEKKKHKSGDIPSQSMTIRKSSSNAIDQIISEVSIDNLSHRDSVLESLNSGTLDSCRKPKHNPYNSINTQSISTIGYGFNENEQQPLKYYQQFSYVAERTEQYEDFTEDLGEYLIETVSMQEKLIQVITDRNEISDEIDTILNSVGHGDINNNGKYKRLNKSNRLKQLRDLFGSVEDRIENAVIECEKRFNEENEPAKKKLKFANSEITRLKNEIEVKDTENRMKHIELESLSLQLKDTNYEVKILKEYNDNLQAEKTETSNYKGEIVKSTSEIDYQQQDNKHLAKKIQDLQNILEKEKEVYQEVTVKQKSEKESLYNEKLYQNDQLVEYQQRNDDVNAEQVKKTKQLTKEENRLINELSEDNKMQERILQEDKAALMAQLDKLSSENLKQKFELKTCANASSVIIPEIEKDLDNDNTYMNDIESKLEQNKYNQMTGRGFTDSTLGNNSNNSPRSSVNDLSSKDIQQKQDHDKPKSQQDLDNQKKSLPSNIRKSIRTIIDTYAGSQVNVSTSKRKIQNSNVLSKRSIDSKNTSKRTINSSRAGKLSERKISNFKKYHDLHDKTKHVQTQTELSNKIISKHEGANRLLVYAEAGLSTNEQCQTQIQTDLKNSDIVQIQLDLDTKSLQAKAKGTQKLASISEDKETMCLDMRAQRLIEQEDHNLTRDQWERLVTDPLKEDLDLGCETNLDHSKNIESLHQEINKIKSKYNIIWSYSKELKAEFQILKDQFKEKIMLHYKTMQKYQKKNELDDACWLEMKNLEIDRAERLKKSGVSIYELVEHQESDNSKHQAPNNNTAKSYKSIEELSDNSSSNEDPRENMNSLYKEFHSNITALRSLKSINTRLNASKEFKSDTDKRVVIECVGDLHETKMPYFIDKRFKLGQSHDRNNTTSIQESPISKFPEKNSSISSQNHRDDNGDDEPQSDRKTVNKLVKIYKNKIIVLDKKYNSLQRHYLLYQKEKEDHINDLDEKLFNSVSMINDLTSNLAVSTRKAKMFEIYAWKLAKKHKDQVASEAMEQSANDCVLRSIKSISVDKSNVVGNGFLGLFNFKKQKKKSDVVVNNSKQGTVTSLEEKTSKYRSSEILTQKVMIDKKDRIPTRESLSRRKTSTTSVVTNDRNFKQNFDSFQDTKARVKLAQMVLEMLIMHL